MPQDHFGPSQDALRMMIPLVVNERNIKAAAAEKQQQLDFLKQKFEEETLRDIAKQKEDEKKAQLGVYMKILEQGQKSGSQDIVNQVSPEVERLSGVSLPSYESSPEGMRRRYLMMPPEQKDPAYQLMATDQGIVHVPKIPGQGAVIPTGLQPPPQKWEVHPPQPSMRDDRGPIPAGYKLKLDGTLEKIPGGPADERENARQPIIDRRRVTDERALRKDFMGLPEVKTFVQIKSQFGRLEEAMKEVGKSGNMLAVDQALITILNKMLDPESVVRESEYARTAHDMALWNRIKGRVSKWGEGGAGMTDEDRRAIADMAKKFYTVAEGMYNEQVGYFSDLANDYGYAPENIVRLGGITGAGYSRRPQTGAPKYPQEFTDDDIKKQLGIK